MGALVIDNVAESSSYVDRLTLLDAVRQYRRERLLFAGIVTPEPREWAFPPRFGARVPARPASGTG
jgi:hypothetical protein